MCWLRRERHFRPPRRAPENTRIRFDRGAAADRPRPAPSHDQDGPRQAEALGADDVAAASPIGRTHSRIAIVELSRRRPANRMIRV